MTLTLVSLIAGLILLVLGGEALVRGAATIARRAGMSPLAVGLIVVGFGTSMPELVTSVRAALAGSPGIAWGNIVGSNMANTLLILGAAALLGPFVVGRGALWRDGIVALLATGAVLVLALRGPLGLVEGLGLLGALLLYIVISYLLGRRASATDATTADEAPPGRWPVAILFTLAGLALLVVGGGLLVEGAITLARTAGLSETLIGLTIVAVGTSLPELVTSVIAAIRRHGDIAFGNVVGSNIYNLLGIGGATAIIAPGSLPSELVVPGLPILLAVAAAMILVALPRRRFGRRTGAALVAGYAGYIGATVFATT